VARELAAAPEGTEAHFAIELQRALMIIRGPEAPGALEALRALTHAQTRPDRKKAILLEATERASDLGADDLLESLVRDAIVDFPVSSSDRLRVEQQFAAVVLGRAYAHRAKGEFDAALEDFESVARETRSIEALVGALDLHLKAGMKPAVLSERVSKDQALAVELRVYGQAWVLLRSLPELDAAGQKKVRAQCFALLRSQWGELRGHRLGQALSGALRHEEYLAEGQLDQAEHANANYLTALRITRGTPRQTAMVLGQAGLLQLAVGNYRLALAQMDEREKFPYIDNGSGLAVQLGRARALLHVGRLPEAAETAEEALTMTLKSPKLAQWHVLALDRAALTNLAADKYERSLALYDEAMPSLTGRNLLVARLARAAAALGAKLPERTLTDLDAFDQAFAKAEVEAQLKLPHQTVERSARSYQLISAGLRANAQQALGHAPLAATALERVHGLLAASFKEDDRDDELKALALTEARLAELKAESWAATSVTHADQLAARTGAALSEEQVDTVWLQATLYQRRGEKLPPALVERMRHLLDAMTVSADRLWRVRMRWFEVALAADALPVEAKVPVRAAEVP
jgi:tetratricopeptide (TPR) repeat protein